VLAVGAAAAPLGGCGDGDDSGGSPGEQASPVRSDSRRAAEVWAVGDGATGGPAARRVVRMIERADPDRVLYLGDVYEHGTAEEYERNYDPTYGTFADVTAPTPGNHEWDTRDEGYDAYWRAAGVPTDEHHYSFKTAGWELISLNSEAGLERDSSQRRWLRRALAERGNCRIAFWHRPFQSAGRHGDQRQVEPLWRAVSGHAVIVIGGNDHDMQRFKPRDGLVQFVSGAGGRHLYDVDGDDPRLAFADDDRYGALRLDLRPGVARYHFVADDGETLDSGTIRCRRLSG
jgi:Calcineurin-like phosphoesterase